MPGPRKSEAKPLVSLVVPAFNEAGILAANLGTLASHLRTLEESYRWEMVIVNDGSTDASGEIAEAFAKGKDNVLVLHHPGNFGLGQALKFGFNNCRGDYVVVMDIDLSYSPDHIERMLARLRQTHAKLVLASPYVEGGSLANVPWLRKVLSIWANRFLSLFARERYRSLVKRGRLSTLTGMVRAYDGSFLRSLKVRAMSMEINPEIVYKAMLLRARIEEVPARLDWGLATRGKGGRKSSMRMLQHTLSVLLSGFIFRPFMFFIVPGVALLVFAAYVNTWVVIHFLRQYQRMTQYGWILDRASAAVGAAYAEFPHTFIVGGLAAMLSIQLVGLGVLAMQSKKYFEEIFYLVSRSQAHDEVDERA